MFALDYEVERAELRPLDFCECGTSRRDCEMNVKKIAIAALLAVVLPMSSAQAFWGGNNWMPWNWFDDDYYGGPWGGYPGYGYGGPWGGYPGYGYGGPWGGYPGHGYGGYPGHGYGGYPGYGYGGYPGYGWGGYPGYGGW